MVIGPQCWRLCTHECSALEATRAAEADVAASRSECALRAAMIALWCVVLVSVACWLWCAAPKSIVACLPRNPGWRVRRAAVVGYATAVRVV